METRDTVVVHNERREYSDYMTSRMPTAAESKRIEIPQGTPLIDHARVGYDADGRIIRCIITLAPGDRHVIRYETTS